MSVKCLKIVHKVVLQAIFCFRTKLRTSNLPGSQSCSFKLRMRKGVNESFLGQKGQNGFGFEFPINKIFQHFDEMIE